MEGGVEPPGHGGEGGVEVLPGPAPLPSGEGGEVHHGDLQVHQALLLLLHLLLQLLHPGLQLLALGGQVGDPGVEGGEDEVEVLGELQASGLLVQGGGMPGDQGGGVRPVMEGKGAGVVPAEGGQGEGGAGE